MKVLILLAALCGAAEVQETLKESYEAFLQGRQADAAAGYRYIATVGITQPDPDTNLAVLERDLGKPEESLALWLKSSLREAADGFVWNQRGWAYLGVKRPREARESFLKAVDRSSTTAMQAEGYLGAGLSELIAGHPKTALASLRQALVSGPFVMPLAAYFTAQASAAAGEKNASVAYYRQCSGLDPLNLECLRALAQLQDKAGDNRAAWRSYRRLLSLDPSDSQAKARVKKLEPYLPANVEELLPQRRLSRPLLSPVADDLPEPKEKRRVRVALYSGPDGRAGTVTKLYFMVNSEFKVIAANGEVVRDNGRAHDQWEISFREDTNVVEMRDNARNIQYTSRQPFRIVPGAQAARGSVLLKSAALREPEGVDGGDREVRGSVEIVPNPYGFKLVNDLNLEEYVYGAVSSALPEGAPLEAYRAQAVLSRTLALWSKENRPATLEKSDLCDHPACGQRYVGLSEEIREPVKAAAETEGWILSMNGKPAKAPQHDHCGGFTEEAPGLPSIVDSDLPALGHRTPEQLERYLHEFPPRDRYCEAGSLSPAAQSRWLRLIRSEDMRDRLDRSTPIGAVRHLRVTRRSPTGRVQAVEVTGSRGTATLEGDRVAAVLSPGSLRSTLFTVQPAPELGGFILFGAGSGHGVGLCTSGTIGQAALGRKWKDILKHYFPSLALKDLNAPEPAAQAGKPTPGKYRQRNPKRKK